MISLLRGEEADVTGVPEIVACCCQCDADIGENVARRQLTVDVKICNWEALNYI